MIADVRSSTPRYMRHVIVGLLATVANYITLMSTVAVGGLDALFAAALLANIFGIVIAFLGNYFWVHAGSRKVTKSFILFCGAYAAIGLASAAVLIALRSTILSNTTIAFCLVTLVSAIASYYVNRHFVFQPKVKHSNG